MLPAMDAVNFVSKELGPFNRKSLYTFFLFLALESQLLVVVQPEREAMAFLLIRLPVVGDNETGEIAGEDRSDISQVDAGRVVEVAPVFLSFEGVPQSPVGNVSKGVDSAPGED